MYSMLARGLGRSLEWILLAVICGSSLWMTFLTLGLYTPPS
jgi:hypothetical protein